MHPRTQFALFRELMLSGLEVAPSIAICPALHRTSDGPRGPLGHQFVEFVPLPHQLLVDKQRIGDGLLIKGSIRPHAGGVY